MKSKTTKQSPIAIEEAQSKATGRPVEPTVDVSAALQEAQMLLGLFAADLAAEIDAAIAAQKGKP